MTVVQNHLKNLLTNGLQASAPPSSIYQAESINLLPTEPDRSTSEIYRSEKVPPSSIFPMEPLTPSNLYPMRPLHPCTFYPTESTPLSGVYPVRPSRFNPTAASNIYLMTEASPHFDQATFTSSNPVRPIPSHHV